MYYLNRLENARQTIGQVQSSQRTLVEDVSKTKTSTETMQSEIAVIQTRSVSSIVGMLIIKLLNLKGPNVLQASCQACKIAILVTMY